EGRKRGAGGSATLLQKENKPLRAFCARTFFNRRAFRPARKLTASPKAGGCAGSEPDGGAQEVIPPQHVEQAGEGVGLFLRVAGERRLVVEQVVHAEGKLHILAHAVNRRQVEIVLVAERGLGQIGGGDARVLDLVVLQLVHPAVAQAELKRAGVPRQPG